MKINIKQVTLIAIVFSHFLSPIFAQHHHDSPSVHGMFLFGEEKVYLSHLPMFHAPHDYQVLLEVELPTAELKKYHQAKKSDPSEKVFTIVPESFSLSKIKNELKSFTAQIYKGHFERGGVAISNNTKFNIKKILYFKKFDPNSQKPTKPNYLFLGNENEQYLIHKISSKPDFDHIIKVKIKDIENLELSPNSPVINLHIETTNTQPLQKDELYLAKEELDDKNKYEIEVIESLYLEFGDLSF